MAILCDTDLKKYLKEGKLIVGGADESLVGPCSIDLRLGDEFRVFDHATFTHIDPKNNLNGDLTKLTKVEEGKPFIMHPGEFVLGMTMERIKVPTDMVGRLEGRSSWGRLGIIIHSTAGMINPGNELNITLEIANISKVPIALWPGTRICQIMFERLTGTCETDYNNRKGSKYVNATGTVSSKIKNDFKEE